MNILVTGGCGFIGSQFIGYFLDKYPQARVVNLDLLTYAAHPDTPAYLQKLAPERYSFIQDDIASKRVPEYLKEHKIEAIVNFAAETHVDRSILDASSFIHTNIMGVQNVLEAARAAGNIRLVQVSTDEVYGSLGPDDSATDENAALLPSSPYSASKTAADLLAQAAQRTYGQEILITRASNNFGPFQFPEKLIPVVISNALQDKPIPVYGDGKQVRDWLFVRDHCIGIDYVLQKGRIGEIYNISAEEQKTNIDLIRSILDLLAKPHSLIEHVGDRPAHDRRYALDATKIRKELDWSPETNFDESLFHTVRWYVDNVDWWKKLQNAEYDKYYRANYETKFDAKENPR